MSPSPRTYLTGARVVLPDQELAEAAVLVEDGRIRAIEPAGAGTAVEVDCQGLVLLPGLIDLHCDAIEKEVEPRPGVLFPHPFAAQQIDRRNAAAGITTAYHGVSFAEGELGVRSRSVAVELVQALRAHRPRALIDNRVHLRYEVTDTDSAPTVTGLVQDGAVDLLSLMDHTPGQGQYPTLASYVRYLQRTYHIDALAAETRAARKLSQRDAAWAACSALAATARGRGVPLASHDDDSPARVAQMHALGMRISEFPMTLATGIAARATGMAVLVGSPNVLRGRSQGGGVSARTALQDGAADCLCSDYAPATLIAAVYALVAAGTPLVAAVAMASSVPAAAAGLSDRGALAVGRRADLIAVRALAPFPEVVATWVAGRQVFGAGTAAMPAVAGQYA